MSVSKNGSLESFMSENSTQWIWQPSPEWIAGTNVKCLMDRTGAKTYQEFIADSQERLEEFWELITAETGVHWLRPFDKVLDVSRGVEWARWFVGGKLNIADNCVDRHRDSARPAILWEGEDGRSRQVTFPELFAQTNQLANALRGMGLEPGDRVALCTPMVPEIVPILYACFKRAW